MNLSEAIHKMIDSSSAWRTVAEIEEAHHAVDDYFDPQPAAADPAPSDPAPSEPAPEAAPLDPTQPAA